MLILLGHPRVLGTDQRSADYAERLLIFLCYKSHYQAVVGRLPAAAGLTIGVAGKPRVTQIIGAQGKSSATTMTGEFIWPRA